MTDLWWASTRPELASMSDRARLAVLLDEAAVRFSAQGLEALAALLSTAADELRSADAQDQRVRSVLGTGEGGG